MHKAYGCILRRSVIEQRSDPGVLQHYHLHMIRMKSSIESTFIGKYYAGPASGYRQTAKIGSHSACYTSCRKPRRTAHAPGRTDTAQCSQVWCARCRRPYDALIASICVKTHACSYELELRSECVAGTALSFCRSSEMQNAIKRSICIRITLDRDPSACSCARHVPSILYWPAELGRGWLLTETQHRLTCADRRKRY